jgi:hypothetical protein
MARVVPSPHYLLAVNSFRSTLTRESGITSLPSIHLPSNFCQAAYADNLPCHSYPTSPISPSSSGTRPFPPIFCPHPSHPDKIKITLNQTKESAESKYIDLTKAYKALTDEVTRENLAKYGNPDGPQQREDKIAIPQWVVEGRNNIWVLGAYGLVLGGGIPFVVVSLIL